MPAAQIVAAMVQRFRAVARQLGLKENVHQVVTIASLVERETAVDAERPLVASVFENRLAKTCRSTPIPRSFTASNSTGRWRGTIYESDLTRDTPYNTYLHAGLPPGPVANPGIPSLRAAMDPPKPTISTSSPPEPTPRDIRFLPDAREHNRNVAHYRKAQKKAGER